MKHSLKNHFLTNNIPKTSRFYELPKIHKSEKIKIAVKTQKSEILNSSGNLLSFLLRCGTRPYERRLELTRVGLLAELATHYTTRGA